MRLVPRDQAHHAVAALHVDRPDRLRRIHAEPAALDHRRPAHPDVGVRGRDDHVAHPGQRGVAGEATPGHDRHQRHPAAQSGQHPEGRHVQPGGAADVGVPGPAAAALGEQHHRQPFPGGQLEDAVGLGVVAHALRPGQHGVVVGHHHGLGGGAPEPVRADGRQAGDQAVGRGVGDQVLLGAPAALRGNGQRAVFDEAAGIDQVGDVLPRGAAALLVPLGNRGLPALVEGEQMAVPDLVEVGARPVEIDCGRTRFAVGPAPVRVKTSNGSPVPTTWPGVTRYADGAQRIRRDEHVLHLHRLEHDHLAAGTELDALGRNLDHGAGQLRAQHLLARVQLDRHPSRAVLVRHAAAASSGSFSSRKPVVTAPD